MPDARKVAHASAYNPLARTPLGLPRTTRLARPADFAAVRNGGLNSRDSYFFVTAVKQKGRARIGLAVSRRVSKRAVVRNRIKRRIRESFRADQLMLQRLDILVIALPATAEAANITLARSLSAHWQRLIARCAEH